MEAKRGPNDLERSWNSSRAVRRIAASLSHRMTPRNARDAAAPMLGSDTPRRSGAGSNRIVVARLGQIDFMHELAGQLAFDLPGARQMVNLVTLRL